MPQAVPDLWAGMPLRVSARYEGRPSACSGERLQVEIPHFAPKGTSGRRLSFAEMYIEGSLARPQASIIVSRQRPHFAPLITLRDKFADRVLDLPLPDGDLRRPRGQWRS